MASTTFHPCPQSGCNQGAITTMVGRIIGRASNGCEVRSDTFLVPSNTMCGTCNGAGRVTVEVEAAAPIFDSYADYAAFDADDLRDAAMERELDASEVA